MLSFQDYRTSSRLYHHLSLAKLARESHPEPTGKLVLTQYVRFMNKIEKWWRKSPEGSFRRAFLDGFINGRIDRAEREIEWELFKR